MPQLDSLTFFTQYTWTLLFLFLLFLLVVTNILPRLQQQLAIRTKYARGGSSDAFQPSRVAPQSNTLHLHFGAPLIKTPKGIKVFKTLWNLK